MKRVLIGLVITTMVGVVGCSSTTAPIDMEKEIQETKSIETLNKNELLTSDYEKLKTLMTDVYDKFDLVINILIKNPESMSHYANLFLNGEHYKDLEKDFDEITLDTEDAKIVFEQLKYTYDNWILYLEGLEKQDDARHDYAKIFNNELDVLNAMYSDFKDEVQNN